MTSDDNYDAGVEELRRLRCLAPDPRRADHVRTRCRAQLGRSLKRQAREDEITGFARRVLAPVVVGGFCLLYIAALLTTTLRLHGFFY